MRLTKALLVFALLMQAGLALAEDQPRRIAQHTHQRWTEESGSPAPFITLAQGKDGFLWVGAAESLYRFDGVRFEPIGVEGRNVRQGTPTALMVASNGDVWMYLSLSKQFAVYRDGALHALPEVLDDIPLPPQWMSETPDGAIWVVLSGEGRGLLRYQNGQWRRFGIDEGLPKDFSFSMLVATDGALWVSYSNSIVRLAPGSARFETIRETPSANGRISQDPSGRIWFSEKRGSYAITGPGGQGIAAPVRFPYPTANPAQSGRPMFDRAGNLWLSFQTRGLQYVARPDPDGATSAAEAAARVESFGTSEGLTSNATSRTIVDREGNVWVATEKGLDKFRAATVRFEPTLTKPPPFGHALLSASDGTVYIGAADTVYRVLAGGQPEAILKDVSFTQAICEAPDGAIWILLDSETVVWKDGRVRGHASRAPVTETLHDCAFDRHGDLWVTANWNSMHRYRQGRWEAMFGAVERNKYFPRVMIRDTQQRLVVHWAPQTLSWLDDNGRTSMPIESGPPVPALYELYSTPRGDLLVGGRFGLRQFRDGRVRTISEAQGMQFRSPVGIVETPDGETWTVNAQTISRTSEQDLERAFADPAFKPTSLTLGADDGLPARVFAWHGRRMVRGGDGRIWIATIVGTVWLDPKDIVRNPEPPPVAIGSIVIDGKLQRDPAKLTVPAAPSNIEIGFSALTFSNPKGATVRYRLEGFDKDWVDPGSRRQAFYTNLSPGEYRFHVIASNSEGVWNKTGATLEFEIPPTFVQSKAFIALCVGLALLVLWLLYRLRVAQIAGRMQSRLEERVGERERIARELHDTLLQSVQGLILRFQIVANTLPPDGSSRVQMETALKRADHVVAEGRDRVLDLRSSDDSGDVRGLLQQLVDAAGFDPQTSIRVVVDGEPRQVQSLIAAEIRQIAGEALFNIARHAQARSVDVTIGFDRRELRVEVRDDGVGIADEVLATGKKPDHFGLVGMRERAEKMGGTLSIGSDRQKGTVVTLRVPARLAFADQKRRWWRLVSFLNPSPGSPSD